MTEINPIILLLNILNHLICTVLLLFIVLLLLLLWYVVFKSVFYDFGVIVYRLSDDKNIKFRTNVYRYSKETVSKPLKPPIFF